MTATVIVDGAEGVTLSSVLEVSNDSPVFSRIRMSALFIEQSNIVPSFANRDHGMTENSCRPIASLTWISGRLLATIISRANKFLFSCNSTTFSLRETLSFFPLPLHVRRFLFFILDQTFTLFDLILSFTKVSSSFLSLRTNTAVLRFMIFLCLFLPWQSSHVSGFFSQPC